MNIRTFEASANFDIPKLTILFDHCFVTEIAVGDVIDSTTGGWKLWT